MKSENSVTPEDLYIEQLREVVDELNGKVAKLREALSEISKGEGAYSMDPMEHAKNTIENLTSLAKETLKSIYHDNSNKETTQSRQGQRSGRGSSRLRDHGLRTLQIHEGE